MITRRKFTAWMLMALPAVAVTSLIKPTADITGGEAIQSGRITEAEAAAYLDRTAQEQLA